MEKKILTVNLQEDGYSPWDVDFQRVTCNNIPAVKFAVWNLDDRPEDAIIGRNLFTAEEYIEALRLGIQLANEGYTDIDVIKERR